MSGFEWTEGIEALTLTFLRGGQWEHVAEALRVDPSSERLTTFDSAFDDLDPRSIFYPVQVDELDGWLVVVEPNGFLLADDDLLSGLSGNGEAVSYFRNINAQARIRVVRDGRVVRSFDPVIPDYEPDGEPLPEEHDLPFAHPDVDEMELAFTLVERLTGVRIDEEWLLQRPRRTWLAPEPPPSWPVPPADDAPRRPARLLRLLRRLR